MSCYHLIHKVNSYLDSGKHSLRDVFTLCQSFIMRGNLYNFIFQNLSNRVSITVRYRRSIHINRFNLLCSNAGKLGHIVLVITFNIINIVSLPFTYHLKYRKVTVKKVFKSSILISTQNLTQYSLTIVRL